MTEKNHQQSNKPMYWDMWHCKNEKRWVQRAEEKSAHPKKQPTVATETAPMDWDMWKPTRQR